MRAGERATVAPAARLSAQSSPDHPRRKGLMREAVDIRVKANYRSAGGCRCVMKHSMVRAIVTDVQFWIPVVVLLAGGALLVALR